MLDKQHDMGILIMNFVGQKPYCKVQGLHYNILTLLVVMKQETSSNCIYIFFLTFIFFVIIFILFLTFKVKFKIIPIENVLTIQTGLELTLMESLWKKNVVKSNHSETFSKTSNILAILDCGFKKDFLEPQNKDL